WPIYSDYPWYSSDNYEVITKRSYLSYLCLNGRKFLIGAGFDLAVPVTYTDAQETEYFYTRVAIFLAVLTVWLLVNYALGTYGMPYGSWLVTGFGLILAYVASIVDRSSSAEKELE